MTPTDFWHSLAWFEPRPSFLTPLFVSPVAIAAPIQIIIAVHVVDTPVIVLECIVH